MLFARHPTPVVALNRAIALSRANGEEAGLAALDEIDHQDKLKNYYFFEAARGDMHLRAGRPEVARQHFARALKRTRLQPE